MTHEFFKLFPFMVCLFWTVVFILEWRTAHTAKRMLTLFMAVSTVLYYCHALFFHHQGAAMPVTDCVYAFCNLAVFPLYYLYICRLTDKQCLKLGG